MGAVLRGRDAALNRDLALKVLLDQHRDRADLVDRFVEEAQICGQLQHPGVVPVYELGTLPDLRPFFAMKLVKGETLAALLAGRESPADDLPRFLSIFEAVCQTVAYAHARGVIHRDLKPSNVMVGSFGEVQVMDWGLAKVLPRDGQPAREPKAQPVNETVVSTLRTRGDSDLSEAGSVLGTPAYMAPEQARGETEAIDRRADVFALGSILCEILTGSPAFGGDSAIEILRAAGRADTAAAIDRLARCEADDELIALARDCLAAESERPPGRCRRGGRAAYRLPGGRARAIAERGTGPRRRSGSRSRKPARRPRRPRRRRPPNGQAAHRDTRGDALAGGRTGRRRLAMGRAGSNGPGPRGNGACRTRGAGGDAASRPGAGGGDGRPGPVGRRGVRRREGASAAGRGRRAGRAEAGRASWPPRSPPIGGGPWRRRRQPPAIAGCSTG